MVHFRSDALKKLKVDKKQKKLKYFILSLLPLASHAADPDRASYAIDPNPQYAPPRRPAPQLSKEVVLQDSFHQAITPELVKQRTKMASRVSLSFSSSLADMDFKALATSLPKHLDSLSLCFSSYGAPFKLPAPFLRELRKKSLKELYLSSCILEGESFKALQGLPLQKLKLRIEGKPVGYALPGALTELHLHMQTPPSAKWLKKALGSVRNLKTLELSFGKSGISGGGALERIIPRLKHLKHLKLDCVEKAFLWGKPLNLALSHASPLRVSLNLRNLPFELNRIVGYFKEDSLLEELHLESLSPPTDFRSDESKEAVQHLLSKVKSLSLFPCNLLLTLFYGVEKMDAAQSAVKTLVLRADDHKKYEPWEMGGLASLLGLQSLENVTLSGAYFFSKLFEEGAKVSYDRTLYDRMGLLSFTSLTLDVLNTPERGYDKNFGKFLKAVLEKAPLTSLSLFNGSIHQFEMFEKYKLDVPAKKKVESLESLQGEVEIFSLLSEHKSLKELTLGGVFSKKGLHALFENHALKGLTHLHLKDLGFVHEGQFVRPQDSFSFLNHFVQGEPSTEEEARKVLNLPENLKVSFKADRQEDLFDAR